MSKPKDRRWLVDIFQDDESIPHRPAGGLIQAPDEDSALVKAQRLFRCYESWRVSIRELKDTPKKRKRRRLVE